MFCSRQDPASCFLLSFSDQMSPLNKGSSKNPRVPLLPKLPAHKNYQGAPTLRGCIVPIVVHHSCKDVNADQSVLDGKCGVTQLKIFCQTDRLYWHWVNMCKPVSSLEWQSMQTCWFCRLRFISRSAVHSLFWNASQEKNLHFGGAHTRHIRCSMGELATHVNCAS
jgi:hypothetical protein